jgi:DNA-directed RNA polymerase subunit RPC12/RpoP
LESAGDTFWALGLCGLLVGLLVGFLVLVTGQTTWAVVCCIIAIVAFAQGCVVYTLFLAGAEIIRLLKKSNGLKFSGKISQPTGLLDGVVAYWCSACGAPVPPSGAKCAGCGAEFGPGLTKGKRIE